MIAKNKLFNLRDYGWDLEKMEGITVVSNDTIAVINDNDFGVTSKMVGETTDQDLEHYQTDIDNKTIIYQGKSVDTKIISDTEGKAQNSYLWLIKLSKPLKDFFPK
jgi:hypothetical protein